MFLSFIPAWLACCLLYGTSTRQQVLSEPLPAMSSRGAACVLISLSVALLVNALPSVSALIVGLSLVCCLLPLITLISAYGRGYLIGATVLVGVSCVLFYLMGASA